MAFSSSPQRFFRESFETILVAIFLAFLVRAYVVTGYKVPGDSMMPTLLPGDFILAFRPAGGFKIPLSRFKFGVPTPERGEMVVVTFPDQPQTNYVKRIVALAGDKVEMQQGRLILNDRALDESAPETELARGLSAPQGWAAFQERDGDSLRRILRRTDGVAKDFGPLIVPPGEVLVIGDRREPADDSRYWDTVPVERIEGRVFLVWLSLDWPHLRLDRILKSVH